MRKIGKKNIPRGILIDRGYIFIRIFPNGRQVRKCIGPLKQLGVLDDAIGKLNQYREQIRLGKFDLEEKSRRLTIEQACDTYWELHASKKKSSYHLNIYLQDIKEFFKSRYVDTITYVDVQSFRHQAEKRKSPATVNKRHTVITNLFYKLKEWNRLGVIRPVRLPSDNPGSLVSKASEKDRARKRVLTIEEYDRLLQSATIPLRRILLGAVNTTLRLKDLRSLARANVNPATNQLEGIQAKTGKPYAVPINGVMRQLIETAPGQEIFDFTNWRKQFNEARASAELRDVQFRDLRRTGARLMLQKGVDLATISSYLGHTTIRMTEAYVPPSKDDKQMAGEILGSMYRWKPEATPVATVVKTVVKTKKPASREVSKALK